MKIANVLLICLCCLTVLPTLWGQAENTAAKPGILGYLDPATGAFRPIPQGAEQNSEAAAALTTFGGTITVTLTITVKSTTLTNFVCTATVGVSDGFTISSPRSFAESATAAATGTGTTRTCKLTIPYAWALATQASDSMATSYLVSGTTGATGLPQRTSSLLPLDTRKVPANGAPTNLSANVTI